MIVLENNFWKLFTRLAWASFCPSALHIYPMLTVYVCTEEIYYSHRITTAYLLKPQTAKTVNWNPTHLKSTKASFLLCFHRCPCVDAVPVDPQQLLKQQTPLIIQGIQFTSWGEEPKNLDKPSDWVWRSAQLPHCNRLVMSVQCCLLRSHHNHSQT